MIVSPDINNNMDGSVLRIASQINSPYPIVPITRIEGFVFNPALFELDKYVLLDYSELHWNTENTDTHLFGKNTSDFPDQFPGEEWKKFDDFARNQPPVIYFKRELLNKDKSDFVHPIDYPCWVEPPPIQSREEFNSRPISFGVEATKKEFGYIVQFGVTQVGTGLRFAITFISTNNSFKKKAILRSG